MKALLVILAIVLSAGLVKASDYYPYDGSLSSLNNDSRYEISAIGAFLFAFFNSGATLEFGDEIYCSLKSGLFHDFENIFETPTYNECRDNARGTIRYIGEHHPRWGIAGTILGFVFLAPTAFLYYAYYGAPKSARAIFKTTFEIEVIEGIVCLVGELLTDSSTTVWYIAIGFGIAAGLIRGSMLYFMHRWKGEAGFRQFVMTWVVLFIGSIVYFFNIE